MRRVVSLAVLSSLIVLPGCRRDATGPIGTDPSAYPECPAGEPHLAVGLDVREWDSHPVLLRFDRDYRPCRGVSFEAQGDLTALAGLADGSEAVGLADYDHSRVVLMRGSTQVWGVQNVDGDQPLAVGALTFRGQDAIAVLWGEDHGSGSSARALSFFGAADGSEIASFMPPSESTAFGASASGQTGRVAGLDVWDGLQEYRDDTAGETLGTTGELQLAAPNGAGQLSSFFVNGDRVVALAAQGALFWQNGLPPAFLGPAECRWPAVVGGALPKLSADGATYESVARDPDDSTGALVVVESPLLEDDGTASHVFRLTHRGECERLLSVPSTHTARWASWAGLSP